MADNYFDNELVEGLIDRYQKNKTEELAREIMIHVIELIKRIISCYDFTRFEEKDDLIQHAAKDCFKSLDRFDRNHPKYSSSFNWFSLTAKRSLLNFTLRKKKHRGHADISEMFELEFNNYEITEDFLTKTLSSKLLDLIDRNYIGQQRTNFINLTHVFIVYLNKTRKFKKNDFYAWSRSHGFTNIICRDYIKSLSTHYSSILKDTIDGNYSKINKIKNMKEENDIWVTEQKRIKQQLIQQAKDEKEKRKK